MEIYWDLLQKKKNWKTDMIFVPLVHMKIPPMECISDKNSKITLNCNQRTRSISDEAVQNRFFATYSRNWQTH